MPQAFLRSPHYIGDNVRLLRNKQWGLVKYSSRTQWRVINVPRGLDPELPKTEGPVLPPQMSVFVCWEYFQGSTVGKEG